MQVTFSILYKTQYGEELFVSMDQREGLPYELPMRLSGEELWTGILETSWLNEPAELKYTYVKKFHGVVAEQLNNGFELEISRIKAPGIFIRDEWVADPSHPDIFKTRPFAFVTGSEKKRSKKNSGHKNVTHLIRIKSPLTRAGTSLKLLGSSKKLGQWQEDQCVYLQQENGVFEAWLDLSKDEPGAIFKVVLADDNTGRILAYEPGPDRIIIPAAKGELQVMNLNPQITGFEWKGAGINVPVSSLRSEKNWGVGEFNDLKALADVCVKSGLRLIQLLPVNDTTATHTDKDSYPYSAISAFALHPIYMDVGKLAVDFALKYPSGFELNLQELNNSRSLRYADVLKLKLDTLRNLYQKEKVFFKDDFNWFEFFDIHRHWLQPYAVFCYLRDKYKTADFSNWGEHRHLDEEKLQALASPGNPAYDEISFWYFVQYYLHMQLQDAVDHAHKNGVVIKADLPIGVGRHSVDTWMNPHLFHMDMQAGAPPDAFATKGQNWGFPTYNWEEMAKDNYAWWRARMEQLSNYADAVRIDHVLGFFRIWSIPVSAKEGILGRFVPAIALQENDFFNAGIDFDENRFSQPFITRQLLDEIFQGDADFVQQQFLDGGHFKSAFNTQQKIADFLHQHPDKKYLQQALFDLLADVILIKTETGYHFRIAMSDTRSFKSLPQDEQAKLQNLYNAFFFKNQDGLWQEAGVKKLNALKSAGNNMLLCAEDLGMVPDMVPGVLKHMQIVTLQVERMPKKAGESFARPENAVYESVVTPSTHDMSTLREWWEEDRDVSQQYYNKVLGHYGMAPYFCEPWIVKEIIDKHLQSPAMLSVFLIQDLLAMNADLRLEKPQEERINIPANPDHFWNYRMHITLSEILAAEDFTNELNGMVKIAGRC